MKKSILTEQDITEFRNSMKGVKPLQTIQTITHQKKTPSIISKKFIPISQKAYIQLSDNFYSTEIRAETILSFFRPGLQHKIIRKLKQGKLVIDLELDLHGMTINQAKQALITFITHAIQQNFRWIKIIHGKGRNATTTPRLKNKINQWLRQLPHVLAFHSAKPWHGGSGAVYVLLKIIGDTDAQ